MGDKNQAKYDADSTYSIPVEISANVFEWSYFYVHFSASVFCLNSVPADTLQTYRNWF